jgi:hypothetical protein
VESPQDVDEATHMILVRMREENDRQIPPPPWECAAQAPQRELRVWPPVDQHGRSRWRNDQDGIALANIEHREMQPPIGQGDEHGAREQKAIDRQQTDRSRCDAKKSTA